MGPPTPRIGAAGLLAAAVALALSGLAAGGGAAPSAGAATRPASVLRTACATSALQTERSATWQGRMRRVPRSQFMQMRFRLLTRQPGETAWAPVTGEGLGRWETSQPGVRRYVFDEQVRNLPAPAAYRVVVEFRWLDRARRPLRTLKLRSRVCNQPDVRPDLVITRLAIRPAGEGQAVYRIGIRNAGASAAGPSEVRVAVAGAALPAAPVGELEPRERAVVELAGPRCAAPAQVSAAADAAGAVAESDETNNVRTITCS